MARRNHHHLERGVGAFHLSEPAREDDFALKLPVAKVRGQFAVATVGLIYLADEHEAATVVMLQYLFRRGQKIPHTLVFSELPCQNSPLGRSILRLNTGEKEKPAFSEKARSRTKKA